MYLSKFLVNRQKILDVCSINSALASYFKSENDYFYRLEWYRIGVSVPVKVISRVRPAIKPMPECRLYATGEMPLLTRNSKVRFSIFAVPDFANSDNARDDEGKAEKWLNEALKGSAFITECSFGPSNCLYYNEDGVEKSLQTATINGVLNVKDFEKLNTIRSGPLGRFKRFGCGLLDLYEV